MKALVSLVILLFSFNLLADSRIPDPLQPLSAKEVQDISSGIFNYFSINQLDWKGYSNDPTKKAFCRLKLSEDLVTGLYGKSLFLQYKTNASSEWSSMNGTYMVYDNVIERQNKYRFTEFVFFQTKNLKEPEYKGQNRLYEIIVTLSADETSIDEIKYVRSTQKRKNVGTIRNPKYELTYVEIKDKTEVCK